ncbi:MAG: glycosyl hydrolase [Planctomycetota bacterium]
MDKHFIDDFRNPPSRYRGAPFWAWNGTLDPEELRRQVRLMHRMGLGGFFMHSRVGLGTAYLSDDWFRCVEACIDEAEKLDMQAWLYDEDRWPSGAAGGLVTEDPRYRQRRLVMREHSGTAGVAWDRDTLGMFTATVDGATARDIKRLGRGTKPTRLAKGQTLLVFRVETQQPSSWYNGQTYLDVLNHDAVKRFLEVTHEAYLKRVGQHLGKRVPGIFTDEPNFGHVCTTRGDTFTGEQFTAVPWTGALPKVFRERYGYDLLARLPELFFDVEGVDLSRARYHYNDCITHLFVDAFSRQVGQWCDKHKLQHTGHVLAEETPRSQVTVVGSAMRFYEYMQAPGMDLLTEHRREYDTAKQVSSVARQFGRTWRLTETYGCTGWDFPFAGHKALGDWQAALGINLRCQHLAWYTMEGQAKRDYPAGIFYQSPWWDTYPTVEDYFGRVHVAMTRGREVRDLLVIHPNESTWTLTRKGWHDDPNVHAIDRMLVALRDTLLEASIDFDYGDEEILSRHGTVSTAGGDGPRLRVAKATYRAVVVPPLRTIRGATVKLLKRFVNAGGTVVFAGPVPGFVDAVASDDAQALAASCTRSKAKGPSLVEAVEPAARRIAVTDGKGRPVATALHLLREDADAMVLFVCNGSHTDVRKRMDQGKTPPYLPATTADRTMVRDRTAAFEDVRIRGFAGCKGEPIELDPQTGELVAADARSAGDGWEIRTCLPALGSRLFLIPKGRRAPRAEKRTALKDARRTALGNRKSRWAITLSEPNVVVLDKPRYKIGRGRWQGPREILRVDQAVRDALGAAHRGGRMVQPWARPTPKTIRRTPVRLEYTFDVRRRPAGMLNLAVERPETFTIEVNGATLAGDAESGWWCDRSLRTLPIDPGLLRIGTNHVTLACDYAEDHPGLEIVYLLGEFGVRLLDDRPTVTAAPTALRIGDWTRQGLPFFSGAVAYYRTIRPTLRKGQRLFVQVGDYRGAAVRVRVNGREAGIAAWPPNEVEITHLLGDGGVAELSIELISHRRNSHGPLHLSEKWPRATAPASFTSTGSDWQGGYQLVPVGLMAPPKLIVRR